MGITTGENYHIFVSTSMISWRKPVKTAHFTWSAVFLTDTEVNSLQGKLAEIQALVSGDIRKYLFKGGAKRSLDILGRLSKTLGSVLHISSAHEVPSNANVSELQDHYVPGAIEEIGKHLANNRAKGILYGSCFDLFRIIEHIGPNITAANLVDHSRLELILSDFADWATGQRLWQNAQLAFYAKQVRDFEEWIREHPLLGAKHPLAEVLIESIDKARVHVVKTESWMRARRWEPGKLLKTKDMGAPPPELTTEGRYNHAGRPVLYLGSDDATCGAETVGRYEAWRIWLQSYRVKGKRVLDLARFPDLEEGLDNDESDVLLAALHSAVERPTERQGNLKPEYYVPRFIADVVRLKGYDGILYNSVKGAGTNLVLFDTSSGIHPVGETRVLIYSGTEGVVRLPEAKRNIYSMPCPSCGVVTDDLYRFCLACDRHNPNYDFDLDQ